MFDVAYFFNSVKKLFTRRDVIIIISLVALYFVTRVLLLDRFPIFNDEGIYIQWAKIAKADASWRFISLTDGKQPLQTWGTIPLLKFFPDNALLAGRLFSVITGFIALTGIFTLLYYLFGKRTALFGGLLYVLTPYFLFYDRMAMVDSGVNAGIIWLLFFSILLARTIRLDVAILFGIIAGISLLAKSSVRIFLGLSFLAPILFINRKKKETTNRIINFVFLYGIAAAIALVIYNIQRLSPFFHYVAEKNKTFISTAPELIANPFTNVFSNVGSVPLYVLWESGFILPILGIIGFIHMYRKDSRIALYLSSWILIPYIIVCFVSKVVFPRYLIFFPTFFLIAAAYALGVAKKKTLLLFLFLFIISTGYFNYTILFNQANIPLPPVDRGQYIEGWPAGYGIKEIIEYARVKSKEKKVIILADGNFGLAGDVLNTHIRSGDNIIIKGYWPLEEKELRENQKDLADNYVYVVMAHKFEYPSEWPMKLLKKYIKPGNQSVIYLYELTP